MSHVMKSQRFNRPTPTVSTRELNQVDNPGFWIALSTLMWSAVLILFL